VLLWELFVLRDVHLGEAVEGTRADDVPRLRSNGRGLN
jgi:hypothetical protein